MFHEMLGLPLPRAKQAWASGSGLATRPSRHGDLPARTQPACTVQRPGRTVPANCTSGQGARFSARHSPGRVAGRIGTAFRAKWPVRSPSCEPRRVGSRWPGPFPGRGATACRAGRLSALHPRQLPVAGSAAPRQDHRLLPPHSCPVRPSTLPAHGISGRRRPRRPGHRQPRIQPGPELLAEARFVHRQYPEIEPALLLRMATLAGAEALGWEAETGSLSPGKSADLVVLPLSHEDASEPLRARPAIFTPGACGALAWPMDARRAVVLNSLRWRLSNPLATVHAPNPPTKDFPACRSAISAWSCTPTCPSSATPSTTTSSKKTGSTRPSPRPTSRCSTSSTAWSATASTGA